MKVFSNFGSNLLILSERVLSYHMDKLVIHARTDGYTDTGNDNTRRPKLAWVKSQTFPSWQLQHIMLKAILTSTPVPLVGDDYGHDQKVAH